MKKILYIDYITDCGHEVFNRIQLQALKIDKDVSVDIVMRTDSTAYKDLNVNPILTLSSKLYLNGSLGYRLSLIFVQFLLFFKLRFREYDYVIFSSYDGLTFWMMPTIKSKLLLFNHSNIIRYDNKFERLCAKMIQNGATHLVLNEFMQLRMFELGFKNVKVVSHGFEQKQKKCSLTSSKYINADYNKIIFIPSLHSSDHSFIHSMLESTQFQTFLKENRILVIVKGNYAESKNENIRVVTEWLSDEEYNYLFMKSDLLVLLYYNQFNYRVSGVLFECIANNKMCLMSDTPNFRVYEAVLNYNAFTKHDINLVIHQMKNLLLGKMDNKQLYKDTELLQPEWKSII